MGVEIMRAEARTTSWEVFTVTRTFLVLLMLLSRHAIALSAIPKPTRTPLVRTVDISLEEEIEVTLHNNEKATVKLLDIKDETDPIRGAIRRSIVKLNVNGKEVLLEAANYNLPTSVAGVRIDCPVTGGYRKKSNKERWGLKKDARLRLWPADSPLVAEGTLVLPVKDKWFASAYQTGNEPVYVNSAENGGSKRIYYHSGLDFGGAEGLVELVSAVAGLVVVSGTDVLPGCESLPVGPRYDRLYVLDDRGWIHMHSHVLDLDKKIKVGTRIKMGQKFGVLGKEGTSGGWAHLHYGIKAIQPSGLWGEMDAYPLAWEANRRQNKPKLIAVARPHHFLKTGQTVTLDGSRSRSFQGQSLKFEWTFTDGSKSTGAKVNRKYKSPGYYSEILKATDADGNVAYDFQVVHVQTPGKPSAPAIHAAYAPTQNIKVGDRLTFKVRSFDRKTSGETWDFGDGSPPVKVVSDGNKSSRSKDGYATTTHAYSKPGHYIVSVRNNDEARGLGVAHLHVVVEGPPN